MELPLTRTTGAADAVAGGCPGIRLFTVAQKTAASPRSDVDGKWQVCDPAIAAGFSAVAFHFGREIHRTLGVPVGLIQATWGGTPAEAWTPRAGAAGDPALRPMVEVLDAAEHDPQRRADLAKALAEWETKNFHQDTGNRGERLGYAKGGGGGWAKMEIPQVWENAGLGHRRRGLVPARGGAPRRVGRPRLALSLGALDDFDVTYWNGERIGATGAETPQYYAQPRHYTVPGRLAKAGRNVARRARVRPLRLGRLRGHAGAALRRSRRSRLAPLPPLPLAGLLAIQDRAPPAARQGRLGHATGRARC